MVLVKMKSVRKSKVEVMKATIGHSELEGGSSDVMERIVSVVDARGGKKWKCIVLTICNKL